MSLYVIGGQHAPALGQNDLARAPSIANSCMERFSDFINLESKHAIRWDGDENGSDNGFLGVLQLIAVSNILC
jgi:hypothetical protein